MFCRNALFTQLLLLALVAIAAATAAKVPLHRTAVASGSPRDAARGSLLTRNSTATAAAGGGGRVANGAFARSGMFPYAAKLNIYKDGGQYGCGGSLIAPRLILTAAHCVVDDSNRLIDPGNIEIAIGITDLNRVNKVYYGFRSIIPPYNPRTSWGDIALIQLNTPATAPAGLVALPSFTSIKAGWRLTVMGWGESESAYYPDKLSYATIAASSKSACQRNLRRLGLGSLPSDHFCVGPDRTGKVACGGDSGGPFVYKPTRTSRPTVAGIVSYGPDLGCGENNGNLDVATSVVFWRKWIASMIVKYKLR